MSKQYRIEELMKKKQQPLRLHSLVCVGQQQNTSDCVCIDLNQILDSSEP